MKKLYKNPLTLGAFKFVKMIKDLRIFIYFILFLSHSLVAQEKIESQITLQDVSEMRFGYELPQDSYQNLILHISKNTIQYFNRSTFISVQTKINNEAVEIGRFHLSEYPAEQTSDHLLFHDKIVYEFDVCMWQSVLKNQKEIILKTDGSFEEADIDVFFTAEEGIPPVKVKEIIPLWKSSTEGFLYGKDGIDPKLLPTKTLSINAPNTRAFIQVLIHGIEKNKSPSSRFYFLEINGKEIAKRSIWRDDCSYNPIYPQSENWHESRPNWCPGLKIYPLKHALSEELLLNTSLDIDLRIQKDPQENSGIYSYVISAVLFVLEEPEKDVNVAITEILAPNTDNWHQRYNPICGSPVIVIKNLGKENLEQITFNYGYNYQTDNKYRWKGELGFLEEEIVYLPPLNWYFYEQDEEPENFTAIVSSANKQEEAFPKGKMTSSMELAEVYPYRLTFHIRTDKGATHNALEIFDDGGSPYFLSGDLVSDTNYYFHVNFVPGCYELVLFDAKGDGIEQTDERLPVLEILDQRKGNTLKTFNGDFGGEIREQFMIFR